MLAYLQRDSPGLLSRCLRPEVAAAPAKVQQQRSGCRLAARLAARLAVGAVAAGAAAAGLCSCIRRCGCRAQRREAAHTS